MKKRLQAHRKRLMHLRQPWKNTGIMHRKWQQMLQSASILLRHWRKRLMKVRPLTLNLYLQVRKLRWMLIKNGSTNIWMQRTLTVKNEHRNWSLLKQKLIMSMIPMIWLLANVKLLKTIILPKLRTESQMARVRRLVLFIIRIWKNSVIMRSIRKTGLPKRWKLSRREWKNISKRMAIIVKIKHIRRCWNSIRSWKRHTWKQILIFRNWHRRFRMQEKM